MPNPYSDSIEALSSRTLDPTNARRVMDYVYGLPELIEAASSRLTRDGRAYVEEFPSHPAAGEVAIALGSQMARMQGAVEEFREVFHRVHEKDLERLENPRHYEAKWDYNEWANGE